MALLVTAGGCWLKHPLKRLVVLIFCLGAGLASADEFPLPAGEVTLTITGEIEKFNQSDKLVLDIAMLEQFPEISFVSDTPWTEQPTKWTGVRLSDLFAGIGAQSASFTASAVDDYIVEFMGVDVEKYPVIIAYKKDDQYMSRRDLGPLWIMFPFDDYSELDTQANRALSVWQLIQIDML